MKIKSLSDSKKALTLNSRNTKAYYDKWSGKWRSNGGILYSCKNI